MFSSFTGPFLTSDSEQSRRLLFLISLSQEVQMKERVSDERVLFEYESLSRGYEFAAADRQTIALRFQRSVPALFLFGV
jgi:hypothetical protein